MSDRQFSFSIFVFVIFLKVIYLDYCKRLKELRVKNGYTQGQIEVTIPVKGSIIRSEQVSNDMYVSIDLVEEIIERQLKKYKNKIVDKQQAAASFSKAYVENDYTDDEEIKIVRTKKFDIKPMYPEDACIQMELLGHSFFVFCNAETDQVNVVYKRKGDTYGLIEPEV